MKHAGLPRTRATTPFERLTDFTRRIIAVPKSEVDKKMRSFQRRKKASRNRIS